MKGSETGVPGIWVGETDTGDRLSGKVQFDQKQKNCSQLSLQ